MHLKRALTRSALVVVAVGLVLGFAAAPSWADDDPPELSQAPGPGDPTTMLVEFTSPVAFSTAVSEAAIYPGDVMAIRYDNPELTGEYSFGSGVTPAAFEAEFLAEYGTTPAATALVVATTVPEESDRAAARASVPEIEVASTPFVPPPAVFNEAMQARFTPPVPEEVAARSSSALAGVSDWRVSSAGIQITDYTPNRVTFVSSYWWIDQASPTKIDQTFGVEFEVNFYGPTGNGGLRPFCTRTDTGLHDPAYKARLAVQNQAYNWRVIRPDGVTAPSMLGAYADYNDLGDACGRTSISMGLKDPSLIQRVNDAYGIIFVVDAPKGMAATSTISSVNQVVNDTFCNTGLGGWMALTDCMGVWAGTWPAGAGPQAQTILNISNGFTAPRRCWNSEFWDNSSGIVYDNTSWMCPPL